MNTPLPAETPSFRYLSDDMEARAALERLPQSAAIISLDTETFWNPVQNQSHVSLVQIAAPDEPEVLIIDVATAGIESLRALVESPAVSMAAHNARFDEGILRGAGLSPVGFVDTLRLARMALRLPSYSLQDVVAHLFGIALDKSFQKSNWRRRPLTRAQLAYAAMDAFITLRVYEELKRLLAQQNQLEEALRRATLAPLEITSERTPRKKRPPVLPPRALTAEEQRAVAQLKRWRLEKSNDARLPAYMICPDRTLEQLVIDKPENLDALGSIHGLGASKIARYGEDLLAALRQALNLKESP
ncbi:MAG: HRDC domain-containing protein [Pyrinomonadaceae bacterium]